MKTIIIYALLGLFSISSTIFSKWEKVNPPGQNLNFYGVHFVDSNTGYATAWNDVQSARIFKTTDGGLNWETIVPPASYIFGVNSVGFDKIYVVGYDALEGCGLLYKSFDTGTSWNRMTFNGSPNPYSFGYYTYEPVDETTAFMSGYQGSIIKTTNAGNTWIATNTNSTDVFRVLNFADETTGYAAGGEGFSFNLINAIYKTTDGGNNWSVIRPRAGDISIGNIRFVSPDTGFVFGYFNGAASILKTTDGGTSFTPSYTGGSAVMFQSGDFYNSKLGIGVGNDGLIVMTNDGGETWVTQENVAPETLIWAHYVDENTCYVVGFGGAVYKYTKEGTKVYESLADEITFNLATNPASDNVEIKLSESFKLSESYHIFIYNSIGELVKTEQFTSSTQKINVSDLTAGLYFVRIGNRVGKFVKE